MCSLLLAISLANAAAGAEARLPSEIAGGRVTVVIFISARCPVSNAYGDRLQAIYSDYGSRGVHFLFVNSNVNESDAEVLENTKRHGFSFPVARDRNSELSLTLAAEFTPEAYVLDKNGAVRYHGAIDDAQNPARVKVQTLRMAVDAVLAGKPVVTPVTKAFGCTIKRTRRVP